MKAKLKEDVVYAKFCYDLVLECYRKKVDEFVNKVKARGLEIQPIFFSKTKSTTKVGFRVVGFPDEELVYVDYNNLSYDNLLKEMIKIMEEEVEYIEIDLKNKMGYLQYLKEEFNNGKSNSL